MKPKQTTCIQRAPFRYFIPTDDSFGTFTHLCSGVVWSGSGLGFRKRFRVLLLGIITTLEYMSAVTASWTPNLPLRMRDHPEFVVTSGFDLTVQVWDTAKGAQSAFVPTSHRQRSKRSKRRASASRGTPFCAAKKAVWGGFPVVFLKFTDFAGFLCPFGFPPYQKGSQILRDTFLRACNPFGLRGFKRKQKEST